MIRPVGQDRFATLLSHAQRCYQTNDQRSTHSVLDAASSSARLLPFLGTHLLLLLPPLLLCGGLPLLSGDVAFIAFLFFACLLCLINVAAAPLGGELRPAPPPATGTQAHGQALAAGSGLPVVFWTATHHRNLATSPAAAIASATGRLLMLVGVA